MMVVDGDEEMNSAFGRWEREGLFKYVLWIGDEDGKR